MSVDFWNDNFDITPLLQGTEPERCLASGINISTYNTIPQFEVLFKNLFNEIYKPTLKNLVAEFNSILSLGRSSQTSYALSDTNPSLDASLILKENDLNINCKEGNYAYQYYVECIVLKLNELYDYIDYVNKALLPRLELMKSDSATMANAQVVIDQLKMCDAIVFERIRDFNSYYVFKTDSSKGEYAEYWEEEFVRYFTPGEQAYTSPSKIGSLSSYPDLEALRKLKVESPIYDEASNAWAPFDKELTSFNELTLLDKLKYICVYYKLDLGTSGESRIFFPDDAAIGYPCMPNVVSTSAIEDTKELGALELFYVGYLIDRDGPVNALSSFLEIKTQALRENISIVMRKISALRQYLSFIRRALELLNTSQASGSNRLPDAAYTALTHISGSVMRNLMELKDARGNYLRDRQGNEIRDPFIVIQCKDITTNDGYHLTNTNRYLLVKATQAGLKAFLGDAIVNGNSNGKAYTFDRTFLDTTSWSGLNGLITSRNRTLPVKSYADIDGTQIPSDKLATASQTHILPDMYLPTALPNAPYTIYDKFLYTADTTQDFFFFSFFDRVIIDTHNADGNIYLLQFDGQEQAKQWLPKEIESTPITPSSALGYDWGGDQTDEKDFRTYWRHRNDNVWSSVVDSWTTVINTSVENVKSTIEGINNDVSTMRSKIDTFNSTSSTFRNRAYSAYSTIINNIG